MSSLSLASIKDYIVKKKEAKAGEPLNWTKQGSHMTRTLYSVEMTKWTLLWLASSHRDRKVPVHCRKQNLTVDVVEGCKNSVERWVVDTADVSIWTKLEKFDKVIKHEGNDF